MRRSTKRKLKKAGYNAIQWSWGLPQTLAGAVLYLKHRNNRHFDYGGAKATVWEGDKGVSLGKFIFVPENSSEFLLDHEYHDPRTAVSSSCRGTVNGLEPSFIF